MLRGWHAPAIAPSAQQPLASRVQLPDSRQLSALAAAQPRAGLTTPPAGSFLAHTHRLPLKQRTWTAAAALAPQAAHTWRLASPAPVPIASLLSRQKHGGDGSGSCGASPSKLSPSCKQLVPTVSRRQRLGGLAGWRRQFASAPDGCDGFGSHRRRPLSVAADNPASQAAGAAATGDAGKSATHERLTAVQTNSTDEADSHADTPVQRRLATLQRGMSAELEAGSSDDKEVGSHKLSSRIAMAARGAFQTYYTVVFYNTVIRLLKWLGADAFSTWATPRLEELYARLSGVSHEFEDGRRRPFSLANNYDPDFSIPAQYSAQEFPFGDLDLTSQQRYDPRVAHMLSLAMKLVYEHNDVIVDMIRRTWHLQPLAIIETASMEASSPDSLSSEDGADGSAYGSADGSTVFSLQPDTIPGSEGRRQTKQDIMAGQDAQGDDGGGSAGDTQGRMPSQEHRRGETAFLPSSKAIVLRSAGATIIAFRGTEATNLLNWRTNLTINMTAHRLLGGVHDGFYAALFHRPASGGTTLFEDIVETLRAAAGDVEECRAPSQEPLFITGHSLGGALADVFALALAVKEPELAARVAAVYTWGQPRVGDSTFRDRFQAAYGDRSFRIRNSGDIVPFLLPQFLGYRHHGKEMYLTALGGMMTEQGELRRRALIENLGFPFLYVYKLVAGRVGRRRESWLRTMYRVTFIVAAPGFSSHFPCEYELQMRAALEHKQTT